VRSHKRLASYFRSQVLTNFVLFINFGDSDQLLRLLVGLLIALLDLTLQQQAQPFRSRIDDALNCVVQLMLILFFVLGIVLKLCDTDDGFCSRVVGIDSVYTVSVLMVGVGLIGVMGPIGMVVHQLFYARPVPILRDARTMEPPKLVLGEGERYHLFLCAHRHEPHFSCHMATLRVHPMCVVAGVTSGAPDKTSAPSSSASCSCCSLASSCSLTLMISVRPSFRSLEPRRKHENELTSDSYLHLTLIPHRATPPEQRMSET
jgi:hypothetical protein